MTSRRTFLKNTALTCGALGAGTLSDALAHGAEAPKPTDNVTKAEKPLRILILGGTGFIGPHQVEYARARGHKLTLFNRGKTNAGIFPDVEQLHGDRATGDLKSLKGREWDVVIDNPATLPRWVRETAQLLKDSAKQYVFISTISVYSDNSKLNMDESGPLATVSDPNDEKITGETYGGLKVLAEKEAEKAFPGRATVIRPGLIVGPGDYSDRFSYWPIRIDRGGEVLAPGDPTDPVQIIDARDLAEWSIRMVEQGAMGIYNATGPKARLSMAEMLYGIRAITSADVQFTWVKADFLAEQKVSPWGDMPVWVPPVGETAGFATVNCNKAIAKGLTFRPLAETSKATLDWFKARPAERQAKVRAGIDPKREADILAAWHAKKK
ncbi:MAG: twin-arginine translocation signal domain-containing protein [Blastocatellia bacterium]|nr:twin-arginine translocation signal domain-containing protein [Blastocatellia bacterium]